MAKGNELAGEDMIKVIGELRDYRVKGIVRFSGMAGEPLMNKGTLEAIRVGNGIGLNTGLITNGVLLDKGTHESLAGSTYVSVSLDAGTKETFNRLKGHTDDTFDRIIKNISDLSRFREMNRNRCSFRLSVGYLLHPENYQELVTATEVVRDAGADIIQFKVPFGDAIPAFTGAQVAEVHGLVEEAARSCTDSFHVVRMQTATEQERELTGQLPKPDFPRCYAQFVNGVVGADANVYLCVHYYYNHGKSAVSGGPIGNIRAEGFKQIWEGQRRREAIAQTVPSEHCRYCNRYDHRVNMFVNYLDSGDSPS